MSHDLLPGLIAPREPMTPWRYIALRRQAAGLTIEQAAKAFYRHPDQKADCEANLRLLEQPGARAKPWVAETIVRAFRFDPLVYRQLCEEPADRQPSLCEGCGCSSWEPCITRDGAECRHDDDGVCTACKEKLSLEVMRRAA